MKTIIEMARKAGFEVDVYPEPGLHLRLERFAELVRADEREALAQPAQEPVAWEQFHEHLVERNFCPRCGKRTADLTTIHTCTPPEVNT